MRMAEPLFDEVVRHPRLAKYRKTKAAERVVSVEADGIVVRKAYPEVPPKVENSLTAWGSSAVSGAGRDVEVGRSTAVAVNRSGFGGRGRGP